MRRRSVCALAAAALVSPACGGDGDEPPLPPRAQTLDVAMKEYRFGYKPPRSPGRVVLRGRNTGTVKHEIIMLELPEDFPPIAEQVKGSQRRAVGTLAYMRALRPGARGVLAVDLKRARYALVCLRKAEDGRLHSRKGMATEFRIR